MNRAIIAGRNGEAVTTEASKPYWLHLERYAAPGMATTYTLGYTDASSKGISDAACPTKHYVSWAMLWAALRYADIPESVIEGIGKELTETQTYIITGVWLTDTQLTVLGFPKKS